MDHNRGQCGVQIFEYEHVLDQRGFHRRWLKGLLGPRAWYTEVTKRKKVFFTLKFNISSKLKRSLFLPRPTLIFNTGLSSVKCKERSRVLWRTRQLVSPITSLWLRSPWAPQLCWETMSPSTMLLLSPEFSVKVTPLSHNSHANDSNLLFNLVTEWDQTYDLVSSMSAN